MAKKYDVIVVGAGPAGFTAARAAGENGFNVAEKLTLW
jgi:flavin-dependent dehydrogenase